LHEKSAVCFNTEFRNLVVSVGTVKGAASIRLVLDESIFVF